MWGRSQAGQVLSTASTPASARAVVPRLFLGEGLRQGRVRGGVHCARQCARQDEPHHGALITDVAFPLNDPLTAPRARHETMSVQIAQRTLEDLGFAEVLRALAHRCRTAPGKERAAVRPFLDTEDQVTDALSLVAEARLLSQEQFSLPLGGVSDLRDAVNRSSKGGMLEPRDLIASAQLLYAFAAPARPWRSARRRCPCWRR